MQYEVQPHPNGTADVVATRRRVRSKSVGRTYTPDGLFFRTSI